MSNTRIIYYASNMVVAVVLVIDHVFLFVIGPSQENFSNLPNIQIV